MVKSFVKRALAATLLIGSLAGCSTTAATPTPGALPTASFMGPVSTVSINAGGPAIGSFWADQFFARGATFRNDTPVDTSSLGAGAPPAELFNTERYGEMTYTIPDRLGAQRVTLYFSEGYIDRKGARVFDVKINGTMVLDRFDIFAAAGGQNRAIARTFTTVADGKGQVVIDFVAHVENPKISAIVVTGGGTTATPPPPTPRPTLAPPPDNAPDSVASAGCGKAPTLKNGTITLQSNGTRTYILRVPDNYDANHRYRLVMAYHWMSGSSQAVADGTGSTESPFYGLWDLANGNTIFVAPMGTGSGQNTGWPNVDGRDVAFTDAMLAQLEAGFCIDKTRIFAMGFSYGAGMSYALACARPDVFRAVALYSGAELSGCDGGTKPIAVFASHGIGDSVLDIGRGRALVHHFVQVNGLTLEEKPDPSPGSGTHVCTKFPGGSGKYPIEWCAFEGDHTPNPHDNGQTTSWIPAEVWAFITQF